MAGIRVDLVADFLGLTGMKASIATFYSSFQFTAYENGDVVIGSHNEPRLVMIPNEDQTETFKAAVKKKLDNIPPPQYGKPHPLESDFILSKMPPQIIIVARSEYILWTIQRLTHGKSHDEDNLMLLARCNTHRPAIVREAVAKPKKKKKKKNKKKSDTNTDATNTSCSNTPYSTLRGETE